MYFGGLVDRSFRDAYRNQLPKRRRLSWTGAAQWIGSIASLTALGLYIIAFPAVSNDWKVFVSFIFLFFLLISAIIYIIQYEVKGLHAFSESVYHTHFVNHIIRDILADCRMTGRGEYLDGMNDILNSVAMCFSIITGKQCRASIKEVKQEDLTVETFCRDGISTLQSRDSTSFYHYLDDNTDFANLWYGKNNCTRYFLENDLLKAWKKGTYKNSSFNIYGSPKTKKLFIWDMVVNWKLPYKSTIVWPIRYIPDYKYWPPAEWLSDDAPPEPRNYHDSSKEPHIWGFLCVDCDSRNVFDSIHAPELGAAFADALYTLFTQLEYSFQKLRYNDDAGN